jgi:hypothetical protein
MHATLHVLLMVHAYIALEGWCKPPGHHRLPGCIELCITLPCLVEGLCVLFGLCFVVCGPFIYVLASGVGGLQG